MEAEGSDAAAMEERMARQERMLEQMMGQMQQLVTSSGTAEPAPAPQSPAPPKKATAQKDPAPYGHTPATPEQIKEGAKLLVSPDCTSPFKGKRIVVDKLSANGETVHFTETKTVKGKKEAFKKNTQARFLVVPKPSPSQVTARKAMEHYGLKETDIFLTPQHVFMIIADYLGLTLEELKAVAEAKQGKRVIMLIGSSSYFLVGREKTERWIEIHREVDLNLIKWCDTGDMGLIHKFNWEPNY